MELVRFEVSRWAQAVELHGDVFRRERDRLGSDRGFLAPRGRVLGGTHLRTITIPPMRKAQRSISRISGRLPWACRSVHQIPAVPAGRRAQRVADRESKLARSARSVFEANALETKGAGAMAHKENILVLESRALHKAHSRVCHSSHGTSVRQVYLVDNMGACCLCVCVVTRLRLCGGIPSEFQHFGHWITTLPRCKSVSAGTVGRKMHAQCQMSSFSTQQSGFVHHSGRCAPSCRRDTDNTDDVVVGMHDSTLHCAVLFPREELCLKDTAGRIVFEGYGRSWSSHASRRMRVLRLVGRTMMPS